jgi:phosphatidylglycerophosphate synthase
MKDERIQTSMNRIMARGFLCVCCLLLPASALYRILVLKQDPSEFWDIIVIIFVGMFFLCVAYAKAGFVPHVSRKEWLTIGIVNLVVFLLLFFIMGQMHSVADVGAMLIGYIPALVLVIGAFHFLRRRWDLKEALEDES